MSEQSTSKSDQEQLRKQPGRRVGMKAIAEAANVSIATVSMALSDHPEISEDTKRRVGRICDQLGYRKRPLPASREGRGLAAVCQRLGFLQIGNDLRDPAVSTILQELNSTCAAQHVALQLSSVESGLPDAAIAQAQSLIKDVDALVLCGLVDIQLLRSLGQSRIPYVVLGNTMLSPPEPDDLHVHMIAPDEYAMGRLATESLLRAGHERIGFVSELIFPGLSHWRWRCGYCSALVDAGISIDQRQLFAAPVFRGDGQAAADHFEQLAPDERPTAFVVPDCRIGTMFVSAMRERGIDIPPAKVVIAADQFQASHYGVTDWPRIEYDHTAYVRLGLEQLERIMIQPYDGSETLWVPFTGRNLPA